MNLDIPELEQRATAAAAESSPGVRIVDAVELPGGASSFTFAARAKDAFRGDRIVLKVAPPGLEPVRNRDVLRQARLLRALERVPGIAVPRVLFEDTGAPPFFAMTFVDGESLEPNIDRVNSLPSPSDLDGRARSAARMLAALHAATPEKLGLSREPEVSLTDEIERWVKAFSTVDEEFKAGTDECAARLRKSMPAPIASTIIHGDWRLGNMLCEGRDVRAVIDWEIWARSDPRIDLAWYLLTASPEEHPSAKRHAPGMPVPEELRAEYEAAGGPARDDTGWFTALILFKMAAVLALIVKNQRKRGDLQGYGAQVRPQIPVMIERALTMLR